MTIIILLLFFLFLCIGIVCVFNKEDKSSAYVFLTITVIIAICCFKQLMEGLIELIAEREFVLFLIAGMIGGVIQETSKFATMKIVGWTITFLLWVLIGTFSS